MVLEAETFGQRLRRLRNAAGLTQRELARRAGIALRSINDLESDQRGRPRDATLLALADALQLTADQRGALLTPPGDARAQQNAARREALFLHPQLLLGRDADLATLRPVMIPAGGLERDRHAPGCATTSRLVTLVGPAGIGKTALALHLAADLIEPFRGEVYRVDLTGLLAPQDLPRAIARALGQSSLRGPDPLDMLVGTIGLRELVIVLDGGDIVIDSVADCVAALLRRCVALRFVATCGEPLQIEGEFVWRVEPLPPPTRGTLVALRQNPLVGIFCARAALGTPPFALNSENVALMRACCRWARGVPLALDLIAAQVPRVPHDQLSAALEASADATTLPALIAWSYERLTPVDRTLLRCLATFAAGWPGAASAAFAPLLAGNRADTSLQRLSRAGLVQIEGSATQRYRLHPAIRAYALAELRAAGEETRARACHLDWCISLARDATAAPGGRRRRSARPAALADADPDLAHALIWGSDHLPARGRQLARLLHRALPEHPAAMTSWGRLLAQIGG